MSKQLSDVERLLVAQAIYNKLGKVVSTKDPNSLRSTVSDGYREVWERSGGKTYSMRLAGEKVATYSISETQPTVKEVFDLKDWDSFETWAASEDGWQTILDYVISDPQRFCKFVTEQTGEVPDGVDVRVEHIAGGGYKSAAIKNIDTDRIIEIARDGMSLPTAIAGLLES